MGFGERLREAIQQSGQSIRGFSRELERRGVSGASYPAIDRYLRGKGEPDVTWVREAAAILGFNVEWLVAGTGEPRPTPGAPDPWEHITPNWLPPDTVMQAAYRRVVRRGLNWLDAGGRRPERPYFFEELEKMLLAPLALFDVGRKDLPPGQLEHAWLLLLLAFDAAIPLTAFDRLESLSGPAPPTIAPKAKPKTTKRPKRRSTRTETAR